MTDNPAMDTPRMTCKSLFTKCTNEPAVNQDKFWNLPLTARREIAERFQNALVSNDCVVGDYTHYFLEAWMAFNRWGSCVAGITRDACWTKAVGLDESVGVEFLRLMYASSSGFAAYVERFAAYWPVFDVRAVQRAGLYGMHEEYSSREELVGCYLGREVRAYEPQCWESHRKKSEQVPLDWPHTLSVLYQVRCNLTHGQKAVHSPVDRQIVASAYWVLVPFLAETGYIPLHID